MRSTFAVALLATWLGIVGGFGLLRTSSQRARGCQGPHCATALVGERADVSLAIDVSPTCDVDLSGPICFAEASGRQQALLPNAVPNCMVGHWDFNGDMAADISGSGNHGVTELLHGPSPGGSGHSASFTRNFMMVKNSANLRLSDFTYSFWIYLVDDGSTPAGVGKSATCAH